MREILFRGQIRKYGEKVRMDGTKLPSKWVYGGVFQGKGDFSIIYGMESEDSKFDKYPVYTDTLGQYTGIKDKNGNKVFEGDIVKFNRTNALGWGTQRIGEVRYYDELPIFYIFATTGDGWDWCECDNIEVIGNIHDNPDLLKGND